MISLAQVSVVLWGETIQRLSLCFSPTTSDCIFQSPEDRSERPKSAMLIYSRTSRTMPGTERWLKPIRSVDRTTPRPHPRRTAWVRWGPPSWQQTDLQSVSAMPLTDWVLSASLLTSLCFSILLIYKTEITIDLLQTIKWVNNCTKNSAQHPVSTNYKYVIDWVDKYWGNITVYKKRYLLLGGYEKRAWKLQMTEWRKDWENGISAPQKMTCAPDRILRVWKDIWLRVLFFFAHSDRCLIPL